MWIVSKIWNLTLYVEIDTCFTKELYTQLVKFTLAKALRIRFNICELYIQDH